MAAVNDQSESEYLPEGWTFDENPSYVHGIKITSPDNHGFYSRREVIEAMMRSKLDNRSLFLIWSSLHKEGWQLGGPLLPPGWRWMKYKKDLKYLTEGMVVFISSNDALKYIEGNDDYEKQAAEKFKDWLTIYNPGYLKKQRKGFKFKKKFITNRFECCPKMSS